MSDSVWVLGAWMNKISALPREGRHRPRRGRRVQRARRRRRDDLRHAGDGIAGTSSPARSVRAIAKQIGQTGIPIYNVQNACATGATAVRTVFMSIKAGESDLGSPSARSRWARWACSSAAAAAAARTSTSPRAASVASCRPTAASARPRCPRCSARRAWSTPTSTTASASSSSPRSPRRTTPTRR